MLIASDTAGRVLELMQVIHSAWERNHLQAYKLVVLNTCATKLMETTLTLLDFASSKMAKKFQDDAKNPFELRHVHFVRDVKELQDRFPGPKVVLVSNDGLESGAGRELFINNWAGDKRNMLFFTGRPPVGTLGRHLSENLQLPSITLDHKQKVPLPENEAREFLQRRRAERARQAEEEALQRALENDDEVEDEDDIPGSDNEDETSQAALMKHDIMGSRDGAKASSSFFKQSKQAHAMFACVDDKIKWDAYGEMIRPEDYMIADQQEEPTRDLTVKPLDDANERAAVEDEIPKKAISTRVEVTIACQIDKADFEGRSDGEGILNILTRQVKPKQMIVIHGTKENSEFLSDRCCESDVMGLEDSYTPGLGELVNMTSKNNIYQVLLTDELVSSLEFAPIHGHELSWLDGIFKTEPAAMDSDADDADMTPEVVAKALSNFEGHHKLPKGSATQEQVAKSSVGIKGWADAKEGGEMEVETATASARMDTDMPTLELVKKKDITNRSAYFIGQPRLSDIIETLKQHDIRAEWHRGSLVCDDVVQITRIEKDEGLQYEIQGGLCETYYKVRDLLYKHFAIV